MELLLHCSTSLSVYLVAVHHVPEAGQRVDPHVHVLMLDGSHGELQCGSQVTAAGRQLEEEKIKYNTTMCCTYDHCQPAFCFTFILLSVMPFIQTFL